MAVSLDANSPEGEKTESSEASTEPDSPKESEPEMKEPELERHVVIPLDPSPTPANKGIENEATPERSLSASQSISIDDSVPSPSSISSSSAPSPSPSQPPEPSQTPASNTALSTNTKVAGDYGIPRRPQEFTSQKRPEPSQEKKKKVQYIDFKIKPRIPPRAPPRAPAPPDPCTPKPPTEPSTPNTPMAIDIPSPTPIITPRNSTFISLPSASTIVPRILSGGPVIAAAGTAASEALSAFNLSPSTPHPATPTHCIKSTSAISSAPVVPTPLPPPPAIPPPPLPVFAIAGAHASESLNALNHLSLNSNGHSSTHLSPVSLRYISTHVSSVPTPSKGKGKARATDQYFIDWGISVDSPWGVHSDDIYAAGTAEVEAAMALSKIKAHLWQRGPSSSSYQSKAHVKYESGASGSLTSAGQSANGGGEGQGAEAAPFIQKSASGSTGSQRPARRKAVSKETLLPILEQGEEVVDFKEVETPVPVIVVTPPEDEGMVEDVGTGVQLNANVPTPVPLQAPKNINAGLSINGPAKKPSPSPSVDMEDEEVEFDSPTEPSPNPQGIAIPQLVTFVPTLPSTEEGEEEEPLANFSPPGFAAALPASRPSSPFETSAASFGLRTSPKRSPLSGVGKPRGLNMEIDKELVGRLFVSEPTPERQHDPIPQANLENLPPLAVFFGVRTFSTLIPDPEVAPPTFPGCPPQTTQEIVDEKMDEDALPLPDRVGPTDAKMSLLSRIGALKAGTLSAPLSLGNAPPLDDTPEPTSSFANAPPLGSLSAFPSSFPSLGSAPALGLYTPQQDASRNAPSVATAPAHWPKWGDLAAAWGGAPQTPASTQPPPAQTYRFQTPRRMQTPPSSPSGASPLDLANSFWTSASDSIGTDSRVAEECPPQEDDSSSSGSDYDSDSSSTSWWSSASDSEDDFDRSTKSNGVLTPPRARSNRNARFGVPSRQSSTGTLKVAPHIALTLTLLGLKRDRGDWDESSDSSEDEDFFGGKRQRRYKAPGDAFVRDQFRKALRASAKRSPSIGNLVLPSSPLSSPSDLPLKSLPLPPARRQLSGHNDSDPTIDLFSDDLFGTDSH